MIIDLLRHGEPRGGVRYRGHGCDDPLSEQGWRQMWQAVGESSVDWPWDGVLSSPLVRCRDFAEALCARRPMPLRIAPGLREVGFGEWEGLTREQVRHGRAEEYRAFYADPVANRPPGAEPLADFRRRVEATLADESAALGVQKILVVAHAGVIRAAIGWIMDAPDGAIYRLECDYGSISRISLDAERGWRVGFTNRRR
ncbi:histidine phosphatase family protein [Thioalkalivibrio paradoxus]|uniref:Phosphoglycerate mutase n=1 Tax=Thioalkalivibrio paradoxus ARh 1 TaxID=713585 RepID=W0DLU1_9GAMM|nr:histidine phosphatase family protein [Thioalkalivibrio paradoxus]AHE99426.1 phosphoglycerate mutase [Thioalkalivibrio paradoxus ARh 1]